MTSAPRKYIKTIVGLLLLVWTGNSYAQSEIGIIQSSHLVQSVIHGNPASFSDFRFNLALPSVYVSASNTGFELKDALIEQPSSYRLNLDAALSKMPETGNLIGINASVGAAALSFQVKRKVQLTFFQTAQVDLQLQYPKALPDLLWKGNYPFVGQTLAIGPQLQALGYNAFGAGLAFKVGHKISFGTNIKLLNGLVGIHTSRSDIQVHTQPAYYQLSLKSDWVVHTGGLNDLSDENTTEILADTKTSYLINSQNYGYGIDAGFVWQAKPKWKLGLAVKDLGQIQWTQHAYTLQSKGNIEYDGPSIRLFSEETGDVAGISDSLAQLIDFQGSKADFRTTLPLRILLTTTWNPKPSTQLGTTLHYRNWYGNASWYAAAQVQQRLGRILYLGILMGYDQRAGVQWGANASLRLGPFQFYALTDHVLPFLDPFSGKGTNLRVGLNLAIGK